MKTCPYCAERIQEAAVLCKHCGRDLPADAGDRRGKARKRSPVILLGLVLVLLFLVGYRVVQGAGRGGAAALVTPPRTITVSDSADIDVPAGSVQAWTLNVTSLQPSCRLTGHIEVTSGGHRDVQVLVLPADDYANLLNGHPGDAYFKTDKITALSLDVRTSTPGRLVFAISNMFSALTPKRVQLRGVQATCQ